MCWPLALSRPGRRARRRALVNGAVAVTVLLGGLVFASGADARTVSVRFDLAAGEVGGLRLGVATRAAVIRRFGPPREVVSDVPGGAAGARRLRYACGRGCEFLAQIDAGRFTLGWAYTKPGGRARHRRVRTADGTHLGTRRRAAEVREGARMQLGCVRQLRKVTNGIDLEVTANGPRVDAIAMSTSEASVLC
jgi:hypothetical protein